MAVVYKMTDVYSLSEDFTEKFEVICDMMEGDKLILEEDKLIKDECSSFTQPFTRWWNNQNRYDIIQYIEEQVDSYLSFLKFVYGAHKSQKTPGKERRQLLNIYKKHKNFIAEMVKGLESMGMTYGNTEDISTRITKVINNLQYLP